MWPTTVNKMKLHIIIVSIFLYTVLSLNPNDINFGIDYFKYRNVQMICVLTCGTDVSWPVKFSKSASNISMSVSTVVLDHRVTGDNSFYKCLHTELHSTGVLLDRNCEGVDEAMYLASDNLSFTAQHRWLIIENDTAVSKYSLDNNMKTNKTMYEQCNNNYSVFDILRKIHLSVDADIVVGARNESGYYTLYDVYNVGKIQGGNLIVNEIGHWDVKNGLNLKYNLNEYKYYRRWDFNGWAMRMILVISPAPKTFNSNLLAEIRTIPGMARITQTGAAVLNLIAELHDFRFIYTITDRWIGSFDKNATKVVTNSLYFGEHDISPVIRYLSILHEKIDASPVPLQVVETRFYYRIPTTGPGKFENNFLTPLSPVAWWGVIGISVLCASLLMLSARIEHRSSTVQYAIFSIIALICQQFYEDNVDDQVRRSLIARKMLILVSGLSCVLIYNYYTSSVVSWLLNGPPPSINSLWELLESPLELIFEDIGYTRSWLQSPTYYYNKRNAKVEDQLRQKKVFNKKKNDPLFKSLMEGIRMVQKGGYAYHTEVSSANELISRTFSQSELCELGSLQVMEETPLFTCMPKNSPYKEFITWSLMSIFERGFISCIRARTGLFEVKCEGSSPRAMALGGAAPAFILLAAGYILAAGIMLVERAVFKMKNKQTISNN